MTLSEFEQYIRDWAVNTLSLADDKVILSHGTGPRPKGQYAILNIVTVAKLGEDVREETRELSGDIRADYRGPRKIMTSINIYRDATTQKMINLKSSLDRIITQDYFNGLNIGIVEQSDIRRVPEQIGKAWEDRTQCDFFFHAVFDDVDQNIGEIKQIEVTNEINGETIIVL